MKIAVYHNLPSGGAKRALFNNIKYLVKNGIEVDVYIPSTANENFLPLKPIVNQVFTFPVRPTIKTFFLSLIKYQIPNRLIAELEKIDSEIAMIINQKDYDIVVCEQDQFIYSPFVLKYINKPMLYFCQQPSRENEQILLNLYKEGNFRKKTRYHRYIDKKLQKIELKNASFSQYILANSFFSKESILRRYGLNAHVSYLGIDINNFYPKKVQKQNFVLSVGSCTPAKGFDFIIRSLSLIPINRRPPLIIVANNENLQWKKYLLNLARKKSVSLEIKTDMKNEDFIKLYCIASILLYSPYLEPFGLVPLESLACGTPVIGIKEGGIRESLAGSHSGILVERNEKIFADAIESFLFLEDNKQQLIDKGRAYVEKYWNLEKAGERFLEHIHRVIQNNKKINA